MSLGDRTATPALQAATASGETVIMPPGTAKVTCTDLTGDIEAARAELALRKRAVSQSAHIPTPPLFPSPLIRGEDDAQGEAADRRVRGFHTITLERT